MMSSRGMIKKVIEELIWILIVIVISIICLGLLIGLNNVVSNDAYDISIFDIYFVIKPFDLAIYLFILLGFATYFVKVVVKKFSHEPSNIILLLFTTSILFTIWSINN